MLTEFFMLIVRPLLITLLSTELSGVFVDYDKELMVGVTCQQSMLTPPRHVILPLPFRGPCCSAFNMYFVLWIF